MTIEALEARVARVEGIIEELRSRLTSIEHRLERLEDRVTGLQNSLESRMQMQFQRIIGLLFTSWVTLFLAIILS